MKYFILVPILGFIFLSLLLFGYIRVEDYETMGIFLALLIFLGFIIYVFVRDLGYIQNLKNLNFSDHRYDVFDFGSSIVAVCILYRDIGDIFVGLCVVLFVATGT